MKTKLRITKGNDCLYEGLHDVSDAESFGKACAEGWLALKQQQMEKETSIGALMENLEQDVLHTLIGARITLERP